jgi:hypothetical protein
MSSELLYSEILEEFGKATNKQERINVLRKHSDKRFIFFLELMLDPRVKFDIIMPEKYRPSVEPAGLNYAYLDTEMNKMYRFIKNHAQRPPEYTAEKTTSAIQVILESLHADEAAIFRDLLQKKFKVKNLTAALAKEAFPSINLE